MNEDLMILRGRYLTLQEEQKIKKVEFQSQQDYLKKLLMFIEHGNVDSFKSAEHLQDAKIVINKMIELQSTLSSLTDEISKLKPMTGL
jgi:hypothetical protein